MIQVSYQFMVLWSGFTLFCTRLSQMTPSKLVITSQAVVVPSRFNDTNLCGWEKVAWKDRKRFYIVRLFLLYSEFCSSILKLRLVIIKRKNTFQKSSSILKWIKIEIFLAARKRSFIWYERKKWLHAFLWSYMNC